jgi:TetR/AcrR family transcriptional regulator, regulator of autoinduction and epiphytic fitness
MANKLDGRRARGMRTRAAIIDSLLELVGEGDLSPTAQRIADRAGVSVRSVYQHFNDVEGLFTEAADRARKNAEELREPIDPGLPLDERVDRFVAVRSAILEELRAFIRAARLVEPSSDELRKYRVKLEKDARDELGRVFGRELGKADGATRRQLVAALDLLSTWSAWEHLRDNNTSVRAGRQIMRNGIAALLHGIPAVV